ncbi:glycosyltransferase family 4 protein [Dactylosporangium matsuzakiense]|uniref:Glycosyl transferase family 1 domain-containing protein n=1 Tax=Dactylosporangium matsuzakiense TaxID=53360 RepID=A0A9W6KHC2_9ACTN|nr:glycosyltransferase family 4 protein [Dactylosporangium matsuzakiense]GLL02116.1 hypothetical protein GCM10017581_038580 [Dactylosporangium matsuzakiense]
MPAGQQYQNVKLSVFQVRPLMPRQIQDGSQATLMDVLRHFSRLGVRTDVYCARQAPLPEQFDLLPRVTVRPTLDLSLSNADPYRAPPFHLANVIDVLRRAAQDSDVFYVHDCALRFDVVGPDRPLAMGVFDLIYGHTLTGVLNFKRDRLVTISDYVGACLRETFRRFRPLGRDDLHVVRTGFAVDRFRPRRGGRMRARLGLPEDAVLVLYPHRPEAAKGILVALDAIALLQKKIPAAQYAALRLAVPVWEEVPAGGAPGAGGGPYADMRKYAAERGVEDKLHLHQWVPRHDMPEYYAIGAATVCVGRFPEAFGNVHIESMLSGTPAVVARVAAQRSTVPDELVRKVDPDDTEAIAEHLAEIIQKGERSGPDLIEYLRSHFGLAQMLQGYERALLDCRPSSEVALAQASGGLTADTRLRIPPWAAVLRSGYYHDYSGYHAMPALTRCLRLLSSGVRARELVARRLVTASEICDWLHQGIVVADPPVAVGSGASGFPMGGPADVG